MSEQKSLLNKIKKLSVIGATVAGCWLTQTTKILALPQEVIIQKLQEIPVFAIANEQGSPLVIPTEDNRQVTGIFMSPQDAKSFIEGLKKNNPDVGNQVNVVPVSLAEVYQMSEKNSQQQDGLQVEYVPSNQQRELAKQLNDKYQGGVPLFVAAKTGDEQGYLVIQQNEQQVIPLFFDKQQVQELINEFKQAQPDLANSVEIQIIPLEIILNAFKQGDDEVLNRFILLPPQESIDFIRQNLPQQPQQ